MKAQATAGPLWLSRAVTACTQPGTPQLSGNILRTLQHYLHDGQGGVDAVYCALIDRAVAEPISSAVIAKVVLILKQLLLKYPPSSTLLQTLANFCSQLQTDTSIQLNPADAKVLQYVAACVQRLIKLDSQQPGSRGITQSRSSIPMRGLAKFMSGKGSGAFQPLPTVPSGVMSPISNTLNPSVDASPGQQALHTTRTQGSMAAQPTAPQTSSHPIDLVEAPAPLLLPYTAGLAPKWAVQPPALVQELMAPFCSGGTAGIQGPVDMRWIAHVPGLNPSLTSQPYGRPSVDGSGAAPDATAPISVSTLLRCVLDLSQEEQPAHLEQVAGRLKAEAGHSRDVESPADDRKSAGRVRNSAAGGVRAGLGPAGKAGAGNLGKGGRRRPQLLYHYPPYTCMDVLHMSEADIAVVVEVVCGAAAAHALISHDTDAHQGQAKDVSMPASGGGAHQHQAAGPQQQQQDAGLPSWEDEFDNGELGQVCASLLIKLIFDMWITAGPANSYALVLRMLRKTVTSSKQQIRARAFDVIYNLAIHASLLEPMTQPTHPSPASFGGGWGVASPIEPPQPPLRSSPSLRQDTQADQLKQSAGSMSASDGTSPASTGVEPGQLPPGVQHSQLCAWIRAVLFQLLEDISQANEESEAVWHAALGALLQMCAHGGHWVASYVAAMPLAAMAGLLRACLAFRWAIDIHSHLLRLAAHLLLNSDSSTSSKSAYNTATSVADSAAEMDNGDDNRVAMISPEVGGLQGLLEALSHAPCQAAALDMLAVLIHFLTPDDNAELAVARVLASRGAHLFATALQESLRSPRNTMALRLTYAVSGVVFGPTPAPDAALGPGSGAAATIRALGGTPNPPPNAVPGMGTISGDSTAVLPPSSAKLVLSMLTPVEAEALKPRKIFQQSSQLGSALKATVSHIQPTTVSIDPHLVQHSTAASAWAELKAACSSFTLPVSLCGGGGESSLQLSQHARSPLQSQGAQVVTTSVSVMFGNKGDNIGHKTSPHAMQGGPANHSLKFSKLHRNAPTLKNSKGEKHDESAGQLRSSVVLMSPPTTVCSGRQVALHWLCAVLLQALHSCQGNPLLLTPLNLRTSEPGKFNSQRGSSMTTPSLGMPGQGGVPQYMQETSPSKISSWTSHLADVLLHCVREVVGGCRLLVAAMARAVAEIKHGVPEAGVRHHLVMSAYYIALLWVLQSGNNSSGSDSQLAAQELADYVLAALTQPHSPSSESLAQGSNSIPSSLAGSAFLRTSARLATAGGRRMTAGSMHGPATNLLPAQHLHVATALVSGHADFAPEPLQATAPELLVALIRSCTQARTSAGTMLRGLYGRPETAAAGMSEGAGGTRGRRTTSLAVPAAADGLASTPWVDVGLDRRLALLMALMGRCTLDPDAFAKYGLSHLVKEALLPSEDVRERYYAGVYLLRHWQLNQQDKYWRMLRQLVLQAQQLNDDSLLDNPYLTVLHMTSGEGHPA